MSFEVQLISIAPTFKSWREAARQCLAAALPPQEVMWSGVSERRGEGQQSLFCEVDKMLAPATKRSVPSAFVRAARIVACHRDTGRWDLMYRLLWRLTHGEPHLLLIDTDDDTRTFKRMQAAVNRDIHKCHAFVRFREVHGQYFAWYQPDHFILPLAASHFVTRFRAMRWSIVSPDASVHWDGKRLHHGGGRPKPAADDSDQTEALWCLYYAAIFNPARLKVRAMRQEMPRRYWHTMPETKLIDSLVAGAAPRLQTFATKRTPSAAPHVPQAATLSQLLVAAAGCSA